jgi:hypothetical protein
VGNIPVGLSEYFLALTSPTSGGHSVGIVRLQTKATEFSFFKLFVNINNWHLNVGTNSRDLISS